MVTYNQLRLWSLAVLAGQAAATGLEKRDCAANNCLRQVRATRPAAQSHLASADCSSYLAGSTTTITKTLGSVHSAKTTITITQTSTDFAVTLIPTIAVDQEAVAVISTVVIPAAKRRVATRAVPTYASACTLDGQYASACSCYGVFPPHSTTVTLSGAVTVTKSITTTVTKTITSTETAFFATSTSTKTILHSATVTARAGSFALYAQEAPFKNYFLTLVDDGDFFTVSLSRSTVPSFFTLNSAGNLVSGTASFVAISDDESFNNLLFEAKSASTPSNLLSCTTSARVLNCHTGAGATTFYGCLDLSGEELAPSVFFYPPGADIPDGCYPIHLEQHIA